MTSFITDIAANGQGLLIYVGVALLSWWPLIVFAMVVGGLTSFVAALLAGDKNEATMPSSKSSKPAKRERPAVVDLRDEKSGLDHVPGQRQGVREHQNA